MQAHTEKKQENGSSSTGVKEGNEQDEPGRLYLRDNRPEAIQMRRVQEIANNSSVNTPFQLLDNRPETTRIRKIQEMVNGSSQNQQNLQLKRMADEYVAKNKSTIQKSNTGLPGNLETCIGSSMDDVKMPQNSDRPAQLQAHSYAQGFHIGLGTGQEKHLQQEASNVAQQREGRVNPAVQMKNLLHANYRTIQREPIPPEVAEAAMQERGGAFAHLPYEILTPWGNSPEATNCHGYTISQAVDHWIDGGDLLDRVQNDDNVAVFISNNQIAHSGRYDGDSLTHFLIGIGIVRSTLALNDKAGYVERFNLPDDRADLNALLIGFAAEEAAEARRNLVVQILDRAGGFGVEVAPGATLGDYDNLEDDEDRDQFIANNLGEINRVRAIVNDEHGGEYDEVQ